MVGVNVTQGADKTMVAIARNALDLLGEEELLRIAMAVPRAPLAETSQDQVQRFLLFAGVKPGRARGVETHALYGLYVVWLWKHPATSPSGAARPTRIRPDCFARALSAAGFRRHRAWRRGDARSVLMVDHASAARLRRWAQA